MSRLKNTVSCLDATLELSMLDKLRITSMGANANEKKIVLYCCFHVLKFSFSIPLADVG